ncbi:MAG: hypothetical protein QG573_2740 [Acidobacteriota bacterium]|nr:hypothetical protein [Acidobacteriota bacterium]
MRTEPAGPAGFRVEFDSPAELAAVERASLGVGGLLLPSAEPLPPDTLVALTLEVTGGGEVAVSARVVAALPGALALHLEGSPAEIVRALLAPPPAVEEEAVAIESENGDAAAPASLWEQLRRLTPPQRMLLAPKADRFARAILVQDSDPQVLFALLKNPRLALDEVLRVAKSSFLSFQAAELILKTNPWFANFDVRVALIRNPKLPTPFALRILPTLPDNEVRAIAKGAATSMPLKQAALKRLVGS